MLASAYPPSQHGPLLPTVGTKTTLSFTTAGMTSPYLGGMSHSEQDQTAMNFAEDASADQTDSLSEYVDSYVDFSEYHQAVEQYGEEYVANYVQL